MNKNMKNNNGFLSIFKEPKPILGMLHLMGDNRECVLKHALHETEQMISSGVSGVIIENYFGSVDDVEYVLSFFSKEMKDLIYGVNVLNNANLGFEFAKEYSAKFVQLDSISGHLSPTKDKIFNKFIEKQRENYSGYVLGGVRFKYQPYKSGRSLAEDLLIGKSRCDAIVVTGKATGVETSTQKIIEFRSLIGDFPLFVGAGMTVDSCIEKLTIADGAIVGSYFKEGHVDTGEVNLQYVQEFMKVVSKSVNSI